MSSLVAHGNRGTGLLILAAAACACGAPGLPGGPVRAELQGGAGGKYQCKMVTGADSPWLVEWEPAEKLRLEASTAGGVQLVRYQGCELEVLYGCQVAGGYDLKPVTPKAQTEWIRNEQDIFAKLPLGALALVGSFRQGDTWSLDYVLDALKETAVANVDRSGLYGHCAEATHFVRGMAVGAYRLGAHASRAGGASLEVGAAGVGGGADSAAGVIRADGDYERCSAGSANAADAACQAIVQLFLEPVTGAQGAAAAAAAGVETQIGGGGGTPWAPAAGAGQAVIAFESDPAAAVVSADGGLLCQATPCTKALAKGRHRISMAAERYLAREEVVDVSGNERISWKLVPDFGWVTIRTTPTKLPVSVDGKDAGITPVVRSPLAPGEHDLLVVSPCHETIGRKLSLGRGESREVVLEPAPRESAIEVAAEDEKGNALVADVYIDGVKVGLTPGVYKIPSCSRAIELRGAAGAWQGELRLAEHETVKVRAVMKSAPGSGLIGNCPRDRGALVFVDEHTPTVREPGTDTEWLFCRLGELWDGSCCQGEPSRMIGAWAPNRCPRGFRMPTRDELLGLLDGCALVDGTGQYRCSPCKKSAKCAAMFGDDAGRYWSSTVRDSAGRQLWFVQFDDAVGGEAIGDSEHENLARPVRCIRAK